MTWKKDLSLSRGAGLTVTKSQQKKGVKLNLSLTSPERCLLHWGVTRQGSHWARPSETFWPTGSEAHGATAVQTPFAQGRDGQSLQLFFPQGHGCDRLVFVLFFPDSARWENNDGRNFELDLTGPKEEQAKGEQDSGEALVTALLAMTAGRQVPFLAQYPLPGGRHLAAAVSEEPDDRLLLTLLTDLSAPPILHWGLTAGRRSAWTAPTPALWPPGTTAFDKKAVQTPFSRPTPAGFATLAISLPRPSQLAGISFVLFAPTSGQWFHQEVGDFNIPLGVRPGQGDGQSFSPQNLALMEAIIAGETGRHSWTLMHRFNLCHDLLAAAPVTSDRLATIFVWLRYSALRQLDWQRNFNTKPRELTHAQQRLTLKIASLYHATDWTEEVSRAPGMAQERLAGSSDRELIRLLLSTVGRGAEGGKGQEIRDGILHIMHRHRIKENSGHFMEEWHQKLHNNATPDDIAICEAYLAFLNSGGRLDIFNQVLKEHGVTRERLAGFERPIITDPDYIPHLRDGLIKDFGDYLHLLKSVHLATDLQSAIEAASPHLDDQMRAELYGLVHSGSAPERLQVIARIAELRSRIGRRLGDEKDCATLRDLLYLDLGLDDFGRMIFEGTLHLPFAAGEKESLVAVLLHCVGLSHADREPWLCLAQWQRLLTVGGDDYETTLHTHAAVERMGLMLGAITDRLFGLFQERAQYLGAAFGAESWVVELFTQEIVRGGSLFLLAKILHPLEAELRLRAGLPAWRLVSGGAAAGTVVVRLLKDCQLHAFTSPTILFSLTVSGDEEIPKGVTAVISKTSIDVLAHLSVRARNARIFFATAQDDGAYDALLKWKGKEVALGVNPDGSLDIAPTAVAPDNGAPAESVRIRLARPLPPGAFIIEMERFESGRVGGKALHLHELSGRLPTGVKIPASLAIPFGVCEAVFALKKNKTAASRYNQLVTQVDSDPARHLSGLKEAIMALEPPDDFLGNLTAAMGKVQFMATTRAEDCWHAIKEVWSSKWNERATLSRIKYGIRHDELFMAVLIQALVPARYAFVLHTANPITGDGGEVFGELVLGAGEALVSGRYSGAALSFTYPKTGPAPPRVLSFPSKREVLTTSGLIFRSDSSGEDLAHYAGAGLYDSIAVPALVVNVADYSEDRLVWDKRFRDELIRDISMMGIEAEKGLKGYQDIEGAYAEDGLYLLQSRPQVAVEEKMPTLI